MDWHVPGLIAPADRTPPPRFVTDVVLELGLASHDDVHAAVEAAKTTGARAEAILVEQGILDDERLARAFAERYGLDRLELDHFAIDPAAAALVGVDTALRHEALPVAQLDGGRLLVAIADPTGGPGGPAPGRDPPPPRAPGGGARAPGAGGGPGAPPPPPPPVWGPPRGRRGAGRRGGGPGPRVGAAPPAEPDPAGDDDRVAELG